MRQSYLVVVVRFVGDRDLTEIGMPSQRWMIGLAGGTGIRLKPSVGDSSDMSLKGNAVAWDLSFWKGR
jgi:hypothetical protein